jgi:hypothetical protein
VNIASGLNITGRDVKTNDCLTIIVGYTSNSCTPSVFHAVGEAVAMADEDLVTYKHVETNH